MDDDEPRAGEATTPNYGWTMPTVGASDDAWGSYLNSDLLGIDSIVHGIDTRVIPPGGAIVSDTPPASPTPGMLWFDSVGGQTYVWYNDGGSNQWVPTTNQIGGGGYQLSKGVTDGSDAAAGQIGEVISSVVAGPGVTLTTAVTANVTSIALTAGDWDVQGEVWTALNGGASSVMAGISPTSATILGTSFAVSNTRFALTFPAGTPVLPLRPCRVSLAAPATYYLVAQVTFSTSTTTAFGNIMARRVR